MSEGSGISAVERRVLKFGFGAIFGVLIGFVVGSAFTSGGLGLTASVLACAVGFGGLVAAVSDQTLQKLYKWPWPGL